MDSIIESLQKTPSYTVTEIGSDGERTFTIDHYRAINSKYDMDKVIHEIATAGPNFKAVTQFLWPFKLSNPNGGFRARKLKNFVEQNGDTGDREDHLPALVKKMI